MGSVLGSWFAEESTEPPNRKTGMVPVVYDVKEWLWENQEHFQPPICNKLMFKDGQLKTFFVGGPNSRRDFHMEEGEEFFYMLKGDMNLIVYEQGEFRDILIKEGEVFMLPARIPHSPQRKDNTIGLVIERERSPNEKDCLRYYVEGTDQVLYEKWFHCTNLEELGPLIKEYFESEQYKTGKPIPGAILEDKPIKQDFDRVLESPFSLKDWIQENEEQLTKKYKKNLFEGDYKSRVFVATGCHVPPGDFPETFLYQIEGTARVKMDGKKYEMKENQCVLVPPNHLHIVDIDKGGKTLFVMMNIEK